MYIILMIRIVSGWRDESAVKHTHYSCRELKFYFQCSNGSQLPMTLASRDPMSLTSEDACSQIHITTYTHKYISK